jgi:hypothetical protein
MAPVSGFGALHSVTTRLTFVAAWGFWDVEVGSMRTWKIALVPFCRIGERDGFWTLDWDAGSDAGSGAGGAVAVGLVGWERMVTRGMKEFQLGQVDVSVRAAQTFGEGAAMNVELPR